MGYRETSTYSPGQESSHLDGEPVLLKLTQGIPLLNPDCDTDKNTDCNIFKLNNNGGGFLYYALDAPFYFIYFFRATSEVYGSSQARGQIGAAAASSRHSHSNIRSESHLQPTPQLVAMPDPLSGARDQTHILIDTSRVCNLLSHSQNSDAPFLNK